MLFSISIIIGIGLSFSTSVYFFNFFRIPDQEKIIVVCDLFLLFSFAVFLLIKNNYIKIPISQKHFRITALFYVVFFAISSICLTYYSLQWFPTLNTFEVTILPSTSPQLKSNRVEIYEIALLPFENGKVKPIAIDDIELNGDWNSEGGKFSVSGFGGEKLSFNDFSTNGIRFLLLQGPDAGEIEIKWNGKSKIVNLNSEVYNQALLEFPHKFTWYNLSPVRIILFSFLFISNFISLMIIGLIITYAWYIFPKYLPILQKVTIWQKSIIALVLISPLINLFVFFHYQSNNIFRLERVASNTLAGLDNSSKDNFSNFQVYLKLEELYQGYNLIIPDEEMFLRDVRLRDDQLLTLARLNSIEQSNYNPNITKDLINDLDSLDSEMIKRAARIPFDYYFLKTQNSFEDSLCLWRYDDIVLFIPNSDHLSCKEK